MRVPAVPIALLLAVWQASARPNIPALAHECDSLGQQRACGELANLAERDKNPTVRIQAIAFLKDQVLLTKLALKDSNMDVRKAAIERLTDQTVLASIAVNDFWVGRTALETLTDQVLLAKIVAESTDSDFKVRALARMTDQSSLAKIAAHDSDAKVRAVAAGRLTDQALLAKLAQGDENRGVRLAAIGALADRDALENLAGSLGRFAATPEEAVARASLALQDPTVAARVPSAKLVTVYKSESRVYRGPGERLSRVGGEDVWITIEKGTRTLAVGYGDTPFPYLAPEDTKFIPAKVGILTTMRQLFSQPEFTQDDLARLAQSPVLECSVAATTRPL